MQVCNCYNIRIAILQMESKRVTIKIHMSAPTVICDGIADPLIHNIDNNTLYVLLYYGEIMTDIDIGRHIVKSIRKYMKKGKYKKVTVIYPTLLCHKKSIRQILEEEGWNGIQISWEESKYVNTKVCIYSMIIKKFRPQNAIIIVRDLSSGHIDYEMIGMLQKENVACTIYAL